MPAFTLAYYTTPDDFSVYEAIAGREHEFVDDFPTLGKARECVERLSDLFPGLTFFVVTSLPVDEESHDPTSPP